MSTAMPTVLIVGAGPTGLTLATELARRNVSVRVIDKSLAPDRQTRALGMQARTLELFERHGTVEALLARGLRADRFNVYGEGHRILSADFSGLPTMYPYLLMIPQDHAEVVMANRLADFGVTVERSTELLSLSQAEGTVQTELRHADAPSETLTFDWVVGADGAHSTVRKVLGIEFVGSSFEESFAVADLQIDWDRPDEEFFAFLNRGRFAAFFPMLGGWRRVAIAQPVTSGADRAITRDELQRSITEIVPGRGLVGEVRQAGLFRINQRRAAAHRRGHVFLVGDAAHIHSVVGAQGMNTGIQDAFNLGWKMAAVIDGTAESHVLDTYAVERARVAARLVTGTRRVTRMALLEGSVSTTARRLIAPRVLTRSAVQTRLTRAISQVDVSYHRAGSSSPPNRAAVGDRAPDAPVRTTVGRTRVHELLDATVFTVLSFGTPLNDVHAALNGHHHRVQLVSLPLGSAAARAYQVARPCLVLVRPDGYIAERGTTQGLRAYLDQLHVWQEQRRGDTSERTPACP